MRDHGPLVIANFRGTFDRGEDDTVPAGYFLSSTNLSFLNNGVETRGGLVPDALAVGIALGIKVRRMELYERLGEAQRLLLLDDAGQIWDSVTGSVILSIPAMVDFSCTIMFDRAFITPHNGISGLPGEKVYLYEGSGTARPAAGVGPAPGPVLPITDSVQSGKCEVGVHAFGIIFETSSGALSTIGCFTGFNPVGEHKIDIAQIPSGPSGTVARLVVATKIIDQIVADPTSYTYYLVPNGRINDNTTPTITVDFFDADLTDDASYLLEQLSDIPAGVGIGQYKSSLIVWGENANTSVVRISKPGEPEAHNAADGFVTVYPGVGGGIKNCVEFRNQLLIMKSHRTYSTQDNDDVAATWDIGEVDGSIGTECHGIGQILNIGTNVEDRVFVCDRSGLRLFIGTFPDDGIITFNIDDIWSRITPTSFNNVECSVDAKNALIYVAVPLDGATTPTHILHGDYSEGLNESEVKWTLWSFPIRPTSIVMSLVADVPILKIGSLDGGVTKLDDSALLDIGQRIPCVMKFPLFPVGDIVDQLQHVTGIMLRARGAGIIDITAEGLDGAYKILAQSLALSTAPGKPLFRGMNFTSERCSITLSLSGPNDYIILTKFTLLITPVWEERPQLG